jgi:hypothetical protein
MAVGLETFVGRSRYAEKKNIRNLELPHLVWSELQIGWFI